MAPTIKDKTFAFGIWTRIRYEFQNKIVSLDDLVVSHDPATFELNPKYITKIQPRMRERCAAEMQVINMAKNLDTDLLLGDFHSLDRGTPIVGEDNLVESGNGRVIAMMRAATYHPELWSKYQQNLRAHLGDFGLNRKDLQGISNPVLVRLRLSPVLDRQKFAEEANGSTSLDMSVIEKARLDSEKITLELLQSFKALENESIYDVLKAHRNKEFVTSFINKLPFQEQAGLVDSRGEASAMCINRIIRALFVKTFPGEEGLALAEKFFERTDEQAVANVIIGIGRSLTLLAQAEVLVRENRRYGDLTIAEDLTHAIGVLIKLRKDKMAVFKYLAQVQIFPRELNAFQEDILKQLDTFKRSAKQIGDLLRNYAESVIKSPDPCQISYLKSAVPIKKDLWENAVAKAEDPQDEESAKAYQPTIPDCSSGEVSVRPSCPQAPLVDEVKGGIPVGREQNKVRRERIPSLDHPGTAHTGMAEPENGKRSRCLELFRRHLTKKQMVPIWREMRADGMTLQVIAEASGVSRETVRKAVCNNLQTGVNRIVGKDGKAYPAVRIKRKRRKIPVLIPANNCKQGTIAGRNIIRTYGVLERIIASKMAKGLPEA